MRIAKNVKLYSIIGDISEYNYNFSKCHTLVCGDEEKVTERKAAVRLPEVRSYLDDGSCYAEHVLDLNLPRNRSTGVNLTMYERKDAGQNRLMPFESYYHTVEFPPQFFKSKGITLPYDVIVPSASFKSKPFLANSFQQFAMWIQSSSRVLKDKEVSTLFNFDCQDAITFCQQQNRKQSLHCLSKEDECISRYDVITTSNLMDHLSPSNLIIACVPLLKVDGLLITTSMCCRDFPGIYTGEEFLNSYFGLDSKMFPVVLGVRCISHEGSDWSNHIKINPFLPDLTHSPKFLPHARTKVCMGKNV